MTAGYIPLGYGDVALAATLLVLNAALSYALELGLARQLIVAAMRMTVQLLLVGLVLRALGSSDTITIRPSAGPVVPRSGGASMINPDI
jgi:ABC-type iron transport system FetAB permease component